MTRLFTIFIFLPILSLAQNLVPNPSFECGTDTCSYLRSSLDLVKYVCNWNCPTGGTSDVFSTLIEDKSCWASMPYDSHFPKRPYIGSQVPRTGYRFAGLHPFSIKSYKFEETYREYLQVKLTAPLIPGKYYCASMYVTSASQTQLVVNNLGMSFYDEEVERTDKSILRKTPQVIESRIINDTLNWVKITGAFIATSPAQYLAIGNFANNLNTMYFTRPGNFIDFDSLAYYFIDDVSVEPIQDKKFSFTGNTVVCEGTRASISALGGLSDIKWSKLDDTLSIISENEQLIVFPKTTTTYKVTGNNCSLFVTDTITIHVDPAPEIDLGIDTTICPGSTLLLDVATGYANYEWNDNSNENHLVIDRPGTYSIKVSNEIGCSAIDHINIVLQKIPQVNLGNDTTLCSGFFPLHAGSEEWTYQWSNGSQDSVYIPTSPGQYWVAVKNECGQANDSIFIRKLFLPNVITLNNDGRNEKFEIATVEDSKGKVNTELNIIGALNIFDRWGTSIYVDNNYKNDWPKENQELPTGIYYFTYQYETCETYKGWLHVLK